MFVSATNFVIAMEKETAANQDAAAQKLNRRRPKRLGSLAVESKPGRRRGTEADQLHGTEPPAEHIGHMLLAAEAKPESDDLADRDRQLKAILAGKRIETLSRAELLDVSDRIIVDGSSLRQIYETHLVGEHALRRLIAEYLHGGNLKKFLREEIMEREMDFERDPAVRDMAVFAVGHISPDPAANPDGLDKLLAKAEQAVGTQASGELGDSIRDRLQTTSQSKFGRSSRLADIILYGVIAVLLILVVYLYFTRR